MSIVTDFRSFKEFRQKVETSDSDDNKENKSRPGIHGPKPVGPEPLSGSSSTRIIVEAGSLTDDLMVDAAQLDKLFWCPQESKCDDMRHMVHFI